jgi:hypothetical protein
MLLTYCQSLGAARTHARILDAAGSETTLDANPARLIRRDSAGKCRGDSRKVGR